MEKNQDDVERDDPVVADVERQNVVEEDKEMDDVEIQDAADVEIEDTVEEEETDDAVTEIQREATVETKKRTADLDSPTTSHGKEARLALTRCINAAPVLTAKPIPPPDILLGKSHPHYSLPLVPTPRSSASSLSLSLPVPILFCNDRNSERYQIVIPYQEATQLHDYPNNYSQWAVIGSCHRTGWIILWWTNHVVYFNVHTRFSLAIGDMPEVALPALNFLGRRIVGFSSMDDPEDDANVTILMAHVGLRVHIYKFSNATGWYHQQVTVGVVGGLNNLVAYTSVGEHIFWVDLNDGVLMGLLNWRDDGAISWGTRALPGQFVGDFMVCGVAHSEHVFYLVTTSILPLIVNPPWFVLKLNVVNVDGNVGIGLQWVNNCDGEVFYASAWRKGFSMRPRHTQVANTLLVAGFKSSDCHEVIFQEAGGSVERVMVNCYCSEEMADEQRLCTCRTVWVLRHL